MEPGVHRFHTRLYGFLPELCIAMWKAAVCIAGASGSPCRPAVQLLLAQPCVCKAPLGIWEPPSGTLPAVVVALCEDTARNPSSLLG